MFNEINLAKFLSRYCNLTGKDLSKIKHDDVKVLFPTLKRASFDEIYDNPYLLATGEALLVNDGTKVIPYYVPPVSEEEPEDAKEFKMEGKKKEVVNYKKYDYTQMSIYELRCLLRKKFNSYFTQKKARCELQDRGVILSKKYCRCEEKRKLEEMKNEGYQE
jgi:hypothetical protein